MVHLVVKSAFRGLKVAHHQTGGTGRPGELRGETSRDLVSFGREMSITLRIPDSVVGSLRIPEGEAEQPRCGTRLQKT